MSRGTTQYTFPAIVTTACVVVRYTFFLPLVITMGFANTPLTLLLTTALLLAPATNAAESSLRTSAMTRQLRFDNAVDTTDTIYAEAAQAWRMLGVYTDCTTQQDDGTSLCERFLLWAAVRTILVSSFAALVGVSQQNLSQHKMPL